MVDVVQTVQVWEGNGVVPPEIKALVDEIARLKEENGYQMDRLCAQDRNLDEAAAVISNLKYELAKARGNLAIDDPLYPRYDDPVNNDGYFVHDIDGKTHG